MKQTLSRKDMRKLIRKAKRRGWAVTLTGKSHLKWQPPEGAFVITPSTPSDGRAAMNMLAELRRHGLDLT